ncbi:Protein tyrosine phosphatase prl-1 [Chytriomyces hyalinus]|nr:Protein tyrosine phosphatase prl-1 [Chytriomyces hyalinus]KAJ3263295.1 Protein tyrosine phosphatase prl-1 [Chytriomyces hyalinus]
MSVTSMAPTQTQSAVTSAQLPAASLKALAPPAPSTTPTPSPTLGKTRPIPMNRVMTSIDYKNMRFVVFDAPTDSNLEAYLEELKLRNVGDIVRVCDPTYCTDLCTEAGIKVSDWSFADGSIPPAHVINGFLSLCNERFPGGLTGAATFQGDAGMNGVKAIGVHCVAGLGRAPILVAISLIEAGMSPLDAVEYVRARRRGAFNTIQLNYLVETYKRSFIKKSNGVSAPKMASFSFGAFKKDRSSSPTGSQVGGREVLDQSASELGQTASMTASVTALPVPGKEAAKGFKGWFSKKT